MLAFVIFAVTFVVVLIGAVIYLYPGSKRVTTVPGLDPSDPKDGNIPDIGKAGSMHDFLMDLHEDYGPIATFWWGTQLAVSIASPELFREHQSVFDRPPDLFTLFQPLFGADSIQYANGADGRKRRNLYDKAFSHDAVRYYMGIFNELVSELVTKMKTLPKDEHIPLQQYCTALVLKGITITSFGDYFKDDKACLSFRKNYDICWHEMEHSLAHGLPEEGTDRDKAFKQARAQMLSTIDTIIKLRRDNPPPPERQLFIDVLLKNNFPETQIKCDSITFIIGGFHTSSNLLAWTLYFIATHQDIQEKLHKEIESVLGDEDVDLSHITQLVYLRQVLDESLRTSVLAPWAARFQDIDTMLGGHVIPKGTPVIHALGVTLQDEEQWPHPEKFDPERFSPENSKQRDKFAFQPFGFAGKRICPGYRFAYGEISVFLAVLCRAFKFNIVEGQVVEPVYGFVTAPKEEVWVTIEKR
ncbi:cytochrome P450 20A1-like [Amphiura filiformis]|uniref:cytochrome P450 20A1-like n=1 Tax=Amphiura filiformis TaxID=82378 RepID=UPI003B223094